jgi:hypothetical protein
MTLSQMVGVSSIVKAPLTPTLSPQAGRGSILRSRYSFRASRSDDLEKRPIEAVILGAG